MKNPNGNAIAACLQDFVNKNDNLFHPEDSKDPNAAGLRLICDKDSNDYEILFPPCEKTLNEFLVFELSAALQFAKLAGIIKFDSAGLFVTGKDKQSILMYESQDVDVDSESDFKEILIIPQ